MRILVTGGAGFIGSHIVNRYLDEGHSVDIIDNLSTGLIRNIDNRANFFEMNILSPTVEEIIRENNYDVINHHAAQINVRKSVDDPADDIEINYKGSVNLIENAAKNNVKYFIFASSGGVVYGEQKEYPADENHTKNPICPYGINKLAVENYLYYTYLYKGLNYTALRYANVYGPRQNYESEAGVVAIFINNMLNDNDVVINDSGKQTRDFVFVEDVAELNLKLLKNPITGSFNVGTSKEISVNYIFDNLADILKYDKSPLYGPKKQGELFRSCLDSSLILKKLDWKPETDFKEGLIKTVNFFKDIKIGKKE